MNTEEKLKIVHSCLCNGLYYFVNYGINLDWNAEEYDAARESLFTRQLKGEQVSMFDDGTICIEDIWVEMIRTGHSLTVTDLEESDPDDDDDLGPVIGTLSLDTIEANWDKIRPKLIGEMLAETDDANTADCILQTILFGEERYG